MQQIPELLESLLQQQYGHAQTERILEGYSRQRPVTLRVNTLKADTAAVQAELRNAGIAYTAVPWDEHALIIQEARDKGLLIDATYGRRTRAVIIMDSDHVVLSAIQPETVANRLDEDEDEDE